MPKGRLKGTKIYKLTDMEFESRDHEIKSRLMNGHGLSQIQESFRGTPYAINRQKLNQRIHVIMNKMDADFESRVMKSTKFNDTHISILPNGRKVTSREMVLFRYKQYRKLRSPKMAMKFYARYLQTSGRDKFNKS